MTKKPTPAQEKKTQKPAKKKQDEEISISDDEDEPVSFFTFNDKTEIATDEKVETLQSDYTESKTGVSVVAVQSTNPPVSSLSKDQIPSSTSTSQSSTKHVDVAPFPEVDNSSIQAAFSSEENPNAEELETKTYYYEPQSGKSQQYGGYSAVDNNYYVSISRYKNNVQSNARAMIGQNEIIIFP